MSSRTWKDNFELFFFVCATVVRGNQPLGKPLVTSVGERRVIFLSFFLFFFFFFFFFCKQQHIFLRRCWCVMTYFALFATVLKYRRLFMPTTGLQLAEFSADSSASVWFSPCVQIASLFTVIVFESGVLTRSCVHACVLQCQCE